MYGRFFALVVASSLACVAPVIAQAQPSPDQLKKMYDDAMNQLRAAQDRKNELANENQQLKAKLAETEAKLAAARTEIDDAAEKTLTLRTQNAAWRQFVALNPHVLPMWRSFMEIGAVRVEESIATYPGDRDWPFGVR